MSRDQMYSRELEPGQRLLSGTAARPGGQATTAGQPRGPHAGLLALQHDAGNRAVGRLLMRSRAPRARALGQSGPGSVPSIVHQVLRTPGRPLDPAARAYMQPRFGPDLSIAPRSVPGGMVVAGRLAVGAPHDRSEQQAEAMARRALRQPAAGGPGYDLSQVRIHTDGRAAESARAVNALAYTVANHIVFGRGQYAPGTGFGRVLLAHELTHVVQQEQGKETKRVSRFSDTDHYVIEQAALMLSELTPQELEQIHRGNVKRDYSQAPVLVNGALLCELSTFGGYKAVEHFDDFRWNEQLQKWQSRGKPAASGPKDPIAHIEGQLVRFVDALPDPAAFQHVGNAFHAVEDFFAHSNFVELVHGDLTHGRELVTGSVGGPDDVSTLKIIESVSSLETESFYREGANRAIAAAPRLSHARMTKDYKSSPYYMEAAVLAGLVIQEMGMHIVALKKLAAREQRIKYVREVIMGKLKRYLRPPSEQDKWWEALRAARGAEIETTIRQTAAKTPVTVNQCIWSPLRSIEASRDSNIKLFGPAFPVRTKRGHIWVQLGTGFATTPAFAGPHGAVEPRSAEFVPFGAQITGRF